MFGAQSGAFPDDPDLNARLGELWGAYDTMPDWEVNQGLTARDWGVRRFWVQAGLHDPDIVLARFDYAFDAEAAKGLESYPFVLDRQLGRVLAGHVAEVGVHRCSQATLRT